MVVHMFRVCVGPQSSWGQDKCNKAVENWMSKQSEWTDKDVTIPSEVPSFS